VSTYECQKQRNCLEFVHMTLPEAAERRDVINKQNRFFTRVEYILSTILVRVYYC
jgi:hypothetical protein